MAELRRDVLHPQGASESLFLLPKVVSLSCQCPAKACVVLLSCRENGEQSTGHSRPALLGLGTAGIWRGLEGRHRYSLVAELLWEHKQGCREM